MTTIFYFPLIDGNYIRKRDILEITGKRCTQKQIDNILLEIENLCDNFNEKTKFSYTFKKFFLSFVLCLFFGFIIIFASSVTGNKAFTFIGILFITISIMMLGGVTTFAYKIYFLEDRYKQIVNEILTKQNLIFQSKGIIWRIGSGIQILELAITDSIEITDEMLDNIQRNSYLNTQKTVELTDFSLSDMTKALTQD